MQSWKPRMKNSQYWKPRCRLLRFLIQMQSHRQSRSLGHPLGVLSAALLALSQSGHIISQCIGCSEPNELGGSRLNTQVLQMKGSDKSSYSKINRGGLYLQHQWLEPELVSGLLEELRSLEHRDLFVPSGVAIAGIDGEYGNGDRRVAVLQSTLQSANLPARSIVETRLNSLCFELRKSLGRPTLTLEESYYSISKANSKLGMHMDERHEQTKGEQGWDLPTRRSISWLLYLSEDDWGQEGSSGQGGELCAYCRHTRSSASCGAHEGNLQVGWLDPSCENGTLWDKPVYLDSWVKCVCIDEDGQPRWYAQSALYTVLAHGVRTYLTDSFGPDSPSWPSGDKGADDGGMAPAQFAKALCDQLPTDCLRNAFSSIEAVPHTKQDMIKVMPQGGTLVLFDSVTVPHEVLPVVKGERIALAGWFHEKQQVFPEWYGELAEGC